MGEELFFRLAVNRGPALLFSLLNLGVRTEGSLPSLPADGPGDSRGGTVGGVVPFFGGRGTRLSILRRAVRLCSRGPEQER